MGDMTNYKPEGYTTLTPFMVVTDAVAAIDWYADVFGATTVSRMDLPGGGIAHAELDFGDGRLQLSDATPQFGLVNPSMEDAVSNSTCIYVEDADAVVARAKEKGAIVREEVSTFVTGDRYGAIRDPFGQRWAVMTRVEHVSPEEAERRLADWAEKEL